MEERLCAISLIRSQVSIKSHFEVHAVKRPIRIARRPKPLLAAVAVALLCVGAAAIGIGGITSASGAGSPSIEGIWSFNGGQIGIQRLSNGTYAGTVVAETKFAECTHPVGQQIWTSISEQKDGSYWGFHQWYHADCSINPQLGPTAWRILQYSNGSHYLRVCFSNPNTTQPTIDAHGDPKDESEYQAHGVTYGCYDSALIAPLPVAPGPGTSTSGNTGNGTSEGGGGAGKAGSVESLTLPPVNKCLSAKQKSLKIRLKEPRYDPFKTVTITVNGHRVSSVRKGAFVVATVRLSRLHARTITLRVRATTALGHILSAKRTYHVCVKRKAHKSHKKG